MFWITAADIATQLLQLNLAISHNSRRQWANMQLIKTSVIEGQVSGRMKLADFSAEAGVAVAERKMKALGVDYLKKEAVAGVDYRKKEAVGVDYRKMEAVAGADYRKEAVAGVDYRKKEAVVGVDYRKKEALGKQSYEIHAY